MRLPLSGILTLSALLVAAASCTASPPADDGATAPTSSEGALASSTAASQMKAILATAHAAAAGERPAGKCYAAVARYIDTVGYGNMHAQPKGSIGSLPSIPNDYGTYAHQFADYANEGDHASVLGIKRLSLDNPYDAPPGSIVVVRAGTPGTSHPTAGDIAIAAGNGVFYNDGEMSYGGSANFPSGNDYVLGIYVPAGAGAICDSDTKCNAGRAHTGRVCASSVHVCTDGCHEDDDCPTDQSCSHTGAVWSCR